MHQMNCTNSTPCRMSNTNNLGAVQVENSLFTLDPLF